MPAWSPLWLSLRVAGITTAVAFGAALWLGYLLRKKDTGAAVAALPLAFPATIVCAWLFLPAFSWPTASAAGLLFAAPFLTISARDAFLSFDRDYENAAHSLGASDWRTFWRVILPLSYRPIVAAAAIAFARVLTEYAVVLLLANRTRPKPPFFAIGVMAVATIYLGYLQNRPVPSRA